VHLDHHNRGIYLLLARVSRRVSLHYGGRRTDLPSGYAIYVGSAMGGLRQRLSRHLRRDKKHRWHVDTLLDHVRIVDVQIEFGTHKDAECRAASRVASWPGAEPVPGFGASDCSCSTHLFRFAHDPGMSLRHPQVLPNLDGAFREFRKRYENHASKERDPFQCLVSCILSLRTQDPVTHAASRRLFQVVRTPHDMVRAAPADIASLIYPVGMYNQKATRLVDIAEIIMDRFDGLTPSRIDQLISLPGVGRKTANLVRSFAFHLPAVCVDTHVHRITNRWGLVRTRTPDETERVLRHVLPREYWIEINPFLVQHGQQICRPIGPKCDVCPLADWCSFPDLRSERKLLTEVPDAPAHPCLRLR